MFMYVMYIVLAGNGEMLVFLLPVFFFYPKLSRSEEKKKMLVFTKVDV